MVSRSSPVVWPYRSLTSLKWVQVEDGEQGSDAGGEAVAQLVDGGSPVGQAGERVVQGGVPGGSQLPAQPHGTDGAQGVADQGRGEDRRQGWAAGVVMVEHGW